MEAPVKKRTKTEERSMARAQRQPGQLEKCKPFLLRASKLVMQFMMELAVCIVISCLVELGIVVAFVRRAGGCCVSFSIIKQSLAPRPCK